jgi:translocation and assembly module TamB
MNSQTPTRKKTRWKRIVGWSLGGVLVLLIALVTTGIFLVQHSAEIRQRILAGVERSVVEATGAKLEVRDFNMHFQNLSLDLYGITLHGKETNGSEPLLQADHLNIEVKILSLVRREWRLQGIILDHPVLHVFVNKAGENNLPTARQKSSGNISIFDLAIQKVLLDRGEIYYNDQKSALDGELHDLKINVRFDNTQSRYYGDLGYRQGRIQYGTYSPMRHDLRANFDVTPSRFNLDQLVLSTGASHFFLKATVEDYSHDPNVQASYTALLVGDDFRHLLKNPEVPTGVVGLDGSLSYRKDPNRPLLETVSIRGRVGSRELVVNTPSLHAQIHDLGAHYRLEGGTAELENIHARLLGGSVDGKLVVRDLSGGSRARLQASVKDLALQDLAAVSGQESPFRETGLTGVVSADVDATWSKTLNNLVVHSDAMIQAALRKSGASTPLEGMVHADYRNAAQEISLKQSYVKTPQTSITLNGVVSTHAQLQVRMQSSDLHELEILATAFSHPAPKQQSQPLGLYGTASLNASVRGSLSSPQVTGQLLASNLQIKGSSWKVLRTNLSAGPSQVHLSNGDVEAAKQGRISFDVQADLKRWQYMPSSPVSVQFSVARLSLADLDRLIGRTDPVAGTLSANVSVHGSQLNPVGSGNISLENAKIADEPIQSLTVRFQGNAGEVNANLALKLPAGTTEAKLTYNPKTESYQTQLQAANLRLEELRTLSAHKLQINGRLNLSASGHGTLKSPELTAALQVPVLQVQKQTLRGLTFNAKLHDRRADISFNSEVADTTVKAEGWVGVDAPYTANVHLNTGRISFRPLLAVYMPEQADVVTGQTEMLASVSGPLQDRSKLQAHLEIPVFEAKYGQIQLAATKPIRVDYQNGVATLQRTSIQGTGTDIQAQARVPIANPKEASLIVQGKVDLGLVQMMEPDVKSSGQVQFDLNSQGDSAASGIEGQIRLVNGNIESVDLPVGVSNANSVITVTHERMEVSSFQAEVGGGTINLKGGVAYRPAIQFALGLSANNVRLRYPQGVRAVLGSNLALSGTPEAAVLSGQVRIEHVSFTNDFDLSTFMGQFTGESTPPSSPGLAQNIKLNIALQSTSEMNLASSQVSLQGNANLRVVGTVADPVILGRTNLTGGDIFLTNNRYVIQNGTVDFLNATMIEPVVNVQVSTTVNNYNINLHFQGPVERLQTTYTSDPPLPAVDIINLLAFGKTTEAAAANPSPTGVAGGEALLAQGVAGQVSSKVAKIAGVSSLSIDPALGTGSNQSTPGARIAVQERVSGNLFVTFATDVTSTQNQEIEVLYHFNPRWSINVIRDQNGGLGVDAKYRKSF